MKLTIFTPIYNRATFLPLIYKSLCLQTCQDFEWVVVDDGSTDEAKDVMATIQSKNGHNFPISYFYKENGGKHTAINYGVRKATGELFLILDSDDELPAHSVQTILEKYDKIATDDNICGVCGLMSHRDGTPIGTGFPKKEFKANSIEIRYKYKVTGDLLEVFKTSCLKENSFPEIENEKFCPEALIWNRIALRYKLLCFNQMIYYRDYLDGGLTSNIVKIRMKSPKSSTMCYAEMLQLPIPFRYKLKSAINYWRFRLCLHKGDVQTINPLWYFVLPISLLMHLKDLYQIKC